MTSIIRLIRGYYCSKCKIEFEEKIDYDMHVCRYTGI